MRGERKATPSPKSGPSLLYFAYGANLDRRAMARRCPGSRPLGPATLPGYCLAFALPAGFAAAGGLATVLPQVGSRAPGSLYELDPRDLAALDRYEDFPRLYARRTLAVRDRGGRTRPALLYLMRGPVRPVPPSAAYLRAVERGYRDFGIPRGALEAALRIARREASRKAPGATAARLSSSKGSPPGCRFP